MTDIIYIVIEMTKASIATERTKVQLL